MAHTRGVKQPASHSTDGGGGEQQHGTHEKLIC